MKTVVGICIISLLTTGCSHVGKDTPSQERDCYWKSYRNLNYAFWDSQKASERDELIRIYNENAGNPSEDPKIRQASIFNLFRRFVRPGFKSRDCGMVMNDAKWLAEAQITPVRALGGRFPLELPEGSSAFMMQLPTDQLVAKGWILCFTLTGLERKGPIPWEECQQKARDFFQGKLSDNRVRLHEFALIYPLEAPRITEVFTAHGVGLEPPQ